MSPVFSRSFGEFKVSKLISFSATRIWHVDGWIIFHPRYYAIVFPMQAKYQCTIFKAKKICSMTWLSSCVLSSPTLVVQVSPNLRILLRIFHCYSSDSHASRLASRGVLVRERFWFRHSMAYLRNVSVNTRFAASRWHYGRGLFFDLQYCVQDGHRQKTDD